MHEWNQDAHSWQATQPARDAERSTHTIDRERSELSVNANAPIGVFDSGAGGMTILAALRQELPHENYIYLGDTNYIYLGDTAHCPYGARSDAEIIELSVQACRFLIEQGVKLMVVACNTASQAALNSLRATFSSIYFVGVVPAVKPAARATKKGRIGIAATNQAAKAIYLQQLIDEFAGGIQAYAVGCPELVTLVERGELDGPVVEETVKEAFQPILREDVDVIVLGCTHFPALRPVIERITAHQIHIIDSGSAVARRTHYVLDTEGLIQPTRSNPGLTGELQVWCSGNADVFSTVASKLLGYSVTAHQVRL
jgi:glutamate racemase